MRDLEADLAANRGRLLGLAYRMLGSWSDAEDVLQDAYLRIRNTRCEAVRNPQAFLATTVTRLCLDHLKSARRRREVYVGPWLPEPIAIDDTAAPGAATELAENLSFALLLALETLSPPERAAFLLHDVFETPYAEIAEALGKSEAACRQLATRARKAVRAAKPARAVPRETHKRLLTAFAEAIASGDASRLESLLTKDAVAYSDGGGIKLAALKPIRSAGNVARFFTGMARKHAERGGTSRFELTLINGSPGFVIFVDGSFDLTLSIGVEGDRIAAVYSVRNPQKLRLLNRAIEENSLPSC